jgi:PIN domain nuclease of toxin-antitoxin system
MPRAKRAGRRRVKERPANLQRLLLDTHVWLWWQSDHHRLGPATRNAIAEADDVYLSAASAWEISIKISLGKLRLPRGADIESELHRDGFLPLPIDMGHAKAFATLPNIHRDPFDRMLIAQATVEGLTLATADEALTRYAIPLLRASR